MKSERMSRQMESTMLSPVEMAARITYMLELGNEASGDHLFAMRVTALGMRIPYTSGTALTASVSPSK